MTTINSYYKAAAELQHIDISFEEYQSHYVEAGWLTRKVQAVPCFFITIVMKTTYHLAMAIIVGVPKFLDRDSKRFQAELCNIGRDIEEGYACIVVIISDQRGSYHFDRSQFFKEKNILWAVKNEDFDVPPPPLEIIPQDPLPKDTPPSSPPPSPKNNLPPQIETIIVDPPPSRSPFQTPRLPSRKDRSRLPTPSIIRQVGAFVNTPSRMPEELKRAYAQDLIQRLGLLYGETVSFHTPMKNPRPFTPLASKQKPPAAPPIPAAAPFLAGIRDFKLNALKKAEGNPEEHKDHHSDAQKQIMSRRSAIESPSSPKVGNIFHSLLNSDLLKATIANLQQEEESDSDFDSSPSTPIPQPKQKKKTQGHKRRNSDPGTPIKRPPMPSALLQALQTRPTGKRLNTSVHQQRPSPRKPPVMKPVSFEGELAPKRQEGQPPNNDVQLAKNIGIDPPLSIKERMALLGFQ